MRVEVLGPLLTVGGESLLGLSTGPRRRPPRRTLRARHQWPRRRVSQWHRTSRSTTWEGGVTGPDNAALGEDQRLGTFVVLENGYTVNPIALVDDDPDNHVLACLAEDSPAQLVAVLAGLFHDPGDIANPATDIEVTEG